MSNQQYITNRKVYNRPQAIMFADSLITTSNTVVPFGNEFGNNLTNSGDFLVLSDHNRSSLDFGVQRIENRQRMVNGRTRSYWVADKRTLSVSWQLLPSRSYKLRPNFATPVVINGVEYNSAVRVSGATNVGNSATLVTYTVDLTDLELLPFTTGDRVAINGVVSINNKFNFTSGTVGVITSAANTPTIGTTRYTIPVTVASGAGTDTYTSGGAIYKTGTSAVPVGDSPYDKSSLAYTVDGGAGGAELLDWYEKHYGTFQVFFAYDKFTEFGRNDAAYAHLNEYQEVLEMYITDFSYSVQKRGANTYDMWDISMTLEEA